MTTKQTNSDVQPGMDVVGPHGRYIGNVAERRDQDMLINRPEASGVYVPFEAIERVDDGRVILNVAAQDIDLKNWPHPAAGTAISGGMPARPGPAGTGIPSGEPGTPTFESTGAAYHPGPGARNMTDDEEGDTAQQPEPRLPGSNPTNDRGERVKPTLRRRETPGS